MNDTSVDHVLLEPRMPHGWNCTEEEFPRYAVKVRHRELVMEGKGPDKVYMDVSSGEGGGARGLIGLVRRGGGAFRRGSPAPVVPWLLAACLLGACLQPACCDTLQPRWLVERLSDQPTDCDQW